LKNALVLCRFDPLYGPKIFLKAPKSLEDNFIKEVPSLMELPRKEVFIHIFGELKTANLFFKLPNRFARGGFDSFLISLITDLKSNLNLMLANKLLEGYIQYFVNLDDAYLAFDYEPKNHKSDLNKLKEIENFFFSYFESIKPAIKTLEMAEHRYQALFKAARDAIFIVNRDSQVIIDVNLEAEQLVEKTREEIVSHPALELELFDEGLVDPDMVRHLIDKPPPIISRVKKSTGQMLYLEVSVNEIKLGDEYYIQYLFHDITDIQVVEEKLKEHAKKIDTLNKIISVVNQAEDLSKLLTKVLDFIIDLLNLKACCIYLVDKVNNMAKIKAYKGLPQNLIEKIAVFDISKNPYDVVYTQGVALFNDNFPGFIRAFFEGPESILSAAVIPLFSKFEIIGSINMILSDNKSISAEEMELIISIGLEIGTAIEKMQYREYLRHSEARNTILLKHIPFSIFLISNNGKFVDVKLDKTFEKIFDFLSPETLIGKSINDILPEKTAIETLENIEKALEIHKSIEMKFMLPYKNNQIIFHSDIVPISKNQVIIFFKNITRTW